MAITKAFLKWTFRYFSWQLNDLVVEDYLPLGQAESVAERTLSPPLLLQNMVLDAEAE